MAELNFRPDYFPIPKRINIEIIPHSKQVCGITGEWFTDKDGTVQIRVSQMGDLRAEAMHIVHEVVEWAASIIDPQAMSDTLTDAQDEEFLRKRKEGTLPEGHEEPGFGTDCFYGKGHHLGTAMEMILCQHYGMNWIDYDNHVREISKGKEVDF
jgi:hypothetical protein